MRSRRQLAATIASLVGTETIAIAAPRDGWPAFADVRTPEGVVRVALHVGPIGLSHRHRDDVERRFQNPGQGKPIVAPPGVLPVLIGLWNGQQRPILVAMDADHRLGRLTRQSLFIPLSLLEEAERTGWAEHNSTTGELVRAFDPVLLPVFVAGFQQNAPFPNHQLAAIAEAAGLRGEAATPAERARRAASQLVRSAVFGRRVIQAYSGLCAMCGLNFGLLQGAHILPAHAPRSPDEITNGIALCGNHHTAFDQHLIWVEPSTRRIRLHPDLHGGTGRSPACGLFVENTFPQLAVPRDPTHRPSAEMFIARYEFFSAKYGWATDQADADIRASAP